MFVDHVFSKLAYLVNFVGRKNALYKALQVFLRHRRVARKTSACLASASSAVEVRDNHHEVRLGHRIILVYNMSM